jgi:hypothetical protein
MNYKKDIIQNFADSIQLIKSADAKIGLGVQELYETLKEDSLFYGHHAKMINEISKR